MLKLTPSRRTLTVSALTIWAAHAATGQLALAHSELKTSKPAANAAVAAPAELTLAFSESIELTFSGVKLAGPDKTPIKLGAATLDPNDKNHATLIVPIEGRLAPGAYTVVWHNLSTDGHKLNGSYSFIVKP